MTAPGVSHPWSELRKRERVRLARAELILHLAMTVERRKGELLGADPGCLPVAEWPPDDPHVVLCRTYGLTPVDLAKIFGELGDELERRAIRAGYDDHLDPT